MRVDNGCAASEQAMPAAAGPAMAALAATAGAAGESLQQLWQLINAARLALRAWRDDRWAAAELAAMDDRLRRDIGLPREPQPPGQARPFWFE